MSVNDPLIKELKSYTSTFLKLYENNESVTDANKNLINFENCLENIFFYGIRPSTSLFGFVWNSDPWTWIEKTGKCCDFQDYLFDVTNSIESVKTRNNVFTNDGRFRLIVRYCLVRKCLHCPVEHLLSSGKCDKYYTTESIIGDEILVEIFLSVLYQCSKINFKLDLKNSTFLDLSWELPKIVNVEMVPTKNLGVSVTFAGDRAIILRIRSNSVTSECPEVSIGDVIENLNGIHITSSMRGRFGAVMRSQHGKPINLTVVKAIPDPQGTCQFHPAMSKLYKEIDVDPEFIRNRIVQRNFDTSEFKNIKRSKTWNGFKVIYMGNVQIGRNGDVKQIDKAYSTLMSQNPSYRLDRAEKLRIEVMFEIAELGVKCTKIDTGRVIEQNSYMEISACGGVTLMPNYFCYIAGREYCNVCKNFKCYIFLAPNTNLAMTILQGIGQGFQRTHYAV